MFTYKKYTSLFVSLVASSFLMAEEIKTEEKTDIDVAKSLKEGNFKIVPLISSNPTSGTGAGAAISYLYNLDPNSSPSQLMAGAKYTNTGSWSAFAKNDAYLRDDHLRSTTVISLIHNKSQFEIGDESDFGIGEDILIGADEGVQYNVDIVFLAQLLMYEIKEHYFAGGHMFYVIQKFSEANALGEAFLADRGAADANRGTVGIDFAYDTRNKQEKYFPRNSEWILLQGNYSPTFLGSEENYSSAIINARIYRQGFNEDDVWASQFYGQYCSEKTPDGALGALGSRKVLRGFPVGKYKARFMSAAQTEYRYQIPDTKYRAVAFIGGAQLEGGSYGDGGTHNRDGDNGFYYSGGLGLRYALQEKAGVDLHLDIATNNDGEQSVYVGINQAF